MVYINIIKLIKLIIFLKYNKNMYSNNDIILSKIFYKYKGLESPTAIILKNNIQNYNEHIYCCWFCRKSINIISVRYMHKSYIDHKELSILQNIYILNVNYIYLCWECARVSS